MKPRSTGTFSVVVAAGTQRIRLRAAYVALARTFGTHRRGGVVVWTVTDAIGS